MPHKQRHRKFRFWGGGLHSQERPHMFKGIVSRKALGAVAVGSLLMAGCGDAPSGDKNALAHTRQAVTSAINPVAAGRYHMLAVHNGAVWDWGGNQYAQLGNGTTDANAHQTPTQVQGLTGTFVSVATCEDSSLALRSDGTVWSWGYNA